MPASALLHCFRSARLAQRHGRTPRSSAGRAGDSDLRPGRRHLRRGRPGVAASGCDWGGGAGAGRRRQRRRAASRRRRPPTFACTPASLPPRSHARGGGVPVQAVPLLLASPAGRPAPRLPARTRASASRRTPPLPRPAPPNRGWPSPAGSWACWSSSLLGWASLLCSRTTTACRAPWSASWRSQPARFCPSSRVRGLAGSACPLGCRCEARVARPALRARGARPDARASLCKARPLCSRPRLPGSGTFCLRPTLPTPPSLQPAHRPEHIYNTAKLPGSDGSALRGNITIAGLLWAVRVPRVRAALGTNRQPSPRARPLQRPVGGKGGGHPVLGGVGPPIACAILTVSAPPVCALLPAHRR